MVWFSVVATVVVVGIFTFIAAMNRHGDRLVGDEENQPVIWADEEWYKPGWSNDDGPPDG